MISRHLTGLIECPLSGSVHSMPMCTIIPCYKILLLIPLHIFEKTMLDYEQSTRMWFYLNIAEWCWIMSYPCSPIEILRDV